MERYCCDIYCEGCEGNEGAHWKINWGWAKSKVGARYLPQHCKEISGKGRLLRSWDGSNHLRRSAMGI